MIIEIPYFLKEDEVIEDKEVIVNLKGIICNSDLIKFDMNHISNDAIDMYKLLFDKFSKSKFYEKDNAYILEIERKTIND